MTRNVVSAWLVEWSLVTIIGNYDAAARPQPRWG
jgi:hypothetical protein